MRLKNANDYDPTYKTKARVKANVPAAVDVAVVGAGLGGLIAAAYLAQAGQKVAVFDHHYVAGGCCTQFSRGGPNHRYNFDIGLHYIGDCGPQGKIPRLLAGLGITLDYEPMDQDGFDTLVFPDFEFAIPACHELYRQRLYNQFPEEKRGIDRYLRFLLEVNRFVNKLDEKKGKMDFGMAAWALTRGRLAAKYQRATLKDLLDDCTNNPQLQAVFSGQSGDYGVPPSKVSAALHAGLSNHYFAGAYYPKGGGQVIADRLAEFIETHGGSVHLRKGIAEIVVENGKAIGVKTEASRKGQHNVKANTVLSNADLRVTFEQLIQPQHLPVEWQQKTQQFEMAAAIYMSCMGIKGDMRERGMRSSNYWQFDGYDFEAFYDTSSGLKPRGAYITSGSLKDPNTSHHAPAGIQTVEAMTVLSGKPADWGCDQQGAQQWDYKKSDRYLQHKETIQADLIQRVDQLFPGSKDNLVFCESASPMSHIRYTRATDGTGYGLAATPKQYFEHRPGYAGPIQGLYLAGANTRAGHGVLGALMSGHRCAKRIARDLGTRVPDLPETAA